MVDVPVDAEDARKPSRVRLRRGDRDVVEKAETHGPGGLGVVPGRPHERERALRGSVEHTPDRFAGGARRENRGVDRSSAGRGVGIEPDPPALQAEDLADIRLSVDAGELLLGRAGRSRDFGAGDGMPAQVAPDRLQAARGLRVARPRIVAQVRIVIEEERGHGARV